MCGDSSQHVGNRLIGLELDRTTSATPSPYFPKTRRAARIFKDFVRSPFESSATAEVGHCLGNECG